MTESVDLGRKDIFLPINPSALLYDGTHADLVCKTGEATTVIRFPQSLLLQLPTDPRCATVSGRMSLHIRINEDAFVEGVELMEVDGIEVFHDTPTAGRVMEEIPF
ncbi:hypothetical protein ACOI1H_14600 [Loktanella sp. DJP18]|uniref:hypothetical protein n=1 Tax=Loktanella sp. DJP18 TaxID=3409788 RepID=UPI003BB8031C